MDYDALWPNATNFEVRADPSFFIRFLISKTGEVWVTLSLWAHRQIDGVDPLFEG